VLATQSLMSPYPRLSSRRIIAAPTNAAMTGYESLRRHLTHLPSKTPTPSKKPSPSKASSKVIPVERLIVATFGPHGVACDGR
jgi:hypothetical protein